MRTRQTIALLILGAACAFCATMFWRAVCSRPVPVQANVDDDAGYVQMIRERLDAGREIFYGQNRLVRKICHRREGIRECRDVVARLPPLPTLLVLP